MRRKKRIVSAKRKKYSYESLEKDIVALAETYPQYFHWEILGRSEDDRKIYDVILGNQEALNCILVVAAIHGREYMTSLLCMKQVEYYLRNWDKEMGHQTIGEILGEIAIHVIPMANPDGVTISQYGIQKIQKPELRQSLEWMNPTNTARWKANARGVDLNRNFSYHFYKTGVAGGEGYSGKEALSEKENRALLRRIDSLERLRGLQGIIHYHAMGNEIFGDYEGEGTTALHTAFMCRLAKKITGYPKAEEASAAPGSQDENQESSLGRDLSNHGNLREYHLYRRDIPGITIEIGRCPCPGPIWEFPAIWRKNRDLVIKEAKLLSKLALGD